jgi:hypothetical protein
MEENPMSRSNRFKYLYGLFIFSCAVWFLYAFPLTADAMSVSDLAGTWQGAVFLSGPADSPWYERMTVTIAANGKFSVSGTESNGTIDTGGSGSLSITPAGIPLKVKGRTETEIAPPLCQVDSSYTVMSCTETWKNGSTNLIILAKKATSAYSLADLGGSWQANFLISGADSSGSAAESMAINGTDGSFSGLFTPTDGESTQQSGVVAITSKGLITCPSGSCADKTNQGFMNAGKTFSIGTFGANSNSTLSPDAAVLMLSVKQGTSYSLSELAGTWYSNVLVGSPDSPYWERDTWIVQPDGTFTRSGSTNTGSTITGQTGQLSISNDGIITCTGDCPSGTTFMDAGKTVITFSGTDPNGAGIIGISTKSPPPSPPAPTAPGAPTGVTATPGNKTATVTFVPPTSTGGSAITGYTVIASTGGKKGSGKGKSIVVKGLSNGTGYTFTVTAKNKIGTGPASGASNLVIPSTPPGAPTGVSATAGKGSATVTFTPGASSAPYSVTTNTVTSKPGGITATGDSPVTVTGLHSGTAYTFTVTSTNLIGTGKASKASQKVRPAP